MADIDHGGLAVAGDGEEGTVAGGGIEGGFVGIAHGHAGLRCQASAPGAELPAGLHKCLHDQVRLRGFGGRVHQDDFATMGGAWIEADAGAAALEQCAVEERAGEGLEDRDDRRLGAGVERGPEAQEIILHHAQIVLRQGMSETGHALACLDDELVAERMLLPGGAVRVACVGGGADEDSVNVVERQKILAQGEELDGGAHQALHGGDPVILRLRGAVFHTARHFHG